ncbi:MAG: NAD-glutamate dehydrogenase, partial [Propionibacteriaceae bacterium]|nr:NAD-glutamate dehydrogenase [Propionibacteriaceae bacterium]
MKAEDRSLNSILSTLAPAQADPALWPGFVSGYQAHLMEEPGLDLDPEQVGRQLAAHFMLGRQRVVGRDLVAVTTPEEGARDIVAIPGSTLVQLVSDDLRFLLDTVSMEIRALGWTIRRLEHPQLRVTRAPDGDLTSVGDGDVLESWISMEVYPPLGSSAEKGKQQLSLAVFRALSTVRLVVGDWAEMLQRCGEAAALLTEDSGECRAALDLLTWLMAGNFIFLGYQEYKFVADEFCLVPGTGLGLQSGDPKDSFHAFPVGDRPLAMTKHPRISPVHRPVYLDYVGVREFDANGKMVGERRFLGLLSDSAYAESIEHIPTLAAKARALLQRSGYAPESYGWNAVRRTIANYPRDELFDATLDELAPIVLGAAALRDRPLVRVFLRRDHYRSFVTALVYLPRDRYTTRVRTKIANILLDRLGGESCEHNARVSEAVLARLFFVVKLKSDAPTEVDAEELAAAVEAAAASWDDQVAAGLEDQPAQMRGVEFGEAYQAAYSPDTALDDLRVANELDGDDDVRYAMTCDGDRARFKIFTFLELELHRIIPHLASLGVEVDDEQRFQWQLRDRPVHVYDFGLELGPLWTDSTLARTQFVEAFDASYGGLCEADAFNALVITGLRWQQVAWLRGIARFLKQARVGFSQDYIAQALVANAKLTGRIVEAFEAKFEPGGEGDWEGILAEARAGIDQVASLDQDRILRLFADFITACQRTNAYTGSATLAFKLASQQLAVLPDPKPLAEIFVYSPRVQGVHLRFGPIARGGLRWSDRAEDFRTEVLGLAKAQTVKNTVIVPVGAKGGFVPQRLPADRAQAQAEGLACYRLFIRALLSVTDNIVSGQVVAPVNVRAYDGPDPYLVVAADKGTATFSDEANQISGRLGFWLGDAFASGGSAGYDHKAMGITARGAWESVRRHLHELGLDPDKDDFTVVGIGDMSGDVFGNGMLLSSHIQLVAAFDHRHVFIDPNPDPGAALEERRRLFELPRSSWGDYDASKVSAGGGIYPRSAKAIPVTPEARAALGLATEAGELTPEEYIHAILQAPVDLLWNGGIGTYVKAAGETHAQVGDKANDPVRVDGAQVRARAAGEGGNLGWTHLGRIEYALRGGKVNADFIDNSA